MGHRAEVLGYYCLAPPGGVELRARLAGTAGCSWRQRFSPAVPLPQGVLALPIPPHPSWRSPEAASLLQAPVFAPALSRHASRPAYQGAPAHLPTSSHGPAATAPTPTCALPSCRQHCHMPNFRAVAVDEQHLGRQPGGDQPLEGGASVRAFRNHAGNLRRRAPPCSRTGRRPSLAIRKHVLSAAERRRDPLPPVPPSAATRRPAATRGRSSRAGWRSRPWGCTATLHFPAKPRFLGATTASFAHCIRSALPPRASSGCRWPRQVASPRPRRPGPSHHPGRREFF